MTSEQVIKFLTIRNDWFKYAGEVTEGLRKALWEPALQSIAREVAWEALKRYARKQRDNKAPSLEDLLKCCGEIEDERHREQVQARRQEDDRQAVDAWKKAYAASDRDFRTRSTAMVTGQGLERVASTQAEHAGATSDRGLYAQLMLTLMLRHTSPWVDDDSQSHEKITLDECASQCFAWAEQYSQERPALAEDLRAACAQFERFGFPEEDDVLCPS